MNNLEFQDKFKKAKLTIFLLCLLDETFRASKFLSLVDILSFSCI